MGTARAPCSASGVPPACSARVRKPKVCSAIGLLLVYLPACVRGVDSGSTLYCATGGGVHQVRVPICRLLRIMTGGILVSEDCRTGLSGAEACSLNPAYPYIALFCRLRTLLGFLFFYHIPCIIQRRKIISKFIIFID